ncbi:MAG: TonB-dependent receptor [Saprospiraceae bacterium]
MKINLITLIFSLFVSQLIGQSTISGSLIDGEGAAISFANVVLYNSAADVMLKVESTDMDGKFQFRNIEDGAYYLESSYIGFDDTKKEFKIDDADIDLGQISMIVSSVMLETAVVKARRAMVEVKPDRTVFNVEGTINSAGDNGLGLLRKAPGVLVDNNNNISVLSRSGVMIYIDGKKLPLSGDDLTAYLENLPAEQIDRMDIITNPGAKYEAQGNAGIIDIRLKRDKSHGANGSISGSLSQGKHLRGNLSLSGNYRNKVVSTFGTIGYNKGTRIHDMSFINFQNDLILDETQKFNNKVSGINYRLGSDFFIAKNHTVGFAISGQTNPGTSTNENIINISKSSSANQIDSVLVAGNNAIKDRDQNTYNVNYAFDNKKQTINFDLDYGKFKNSSEYIQPNQYYNNDRTQLLTESIAEYDTPVDIEIYTAKLDFETKFLGGKLGLGTKLSKVATDNTFLFYDVIDNDRIRDDRRSNRFFYDEKVYAGYINYSGSINKKWSYTTGLRSETTDATGDLQAFLQELQEDPVLFNYTKFFPSAGLTWNLARNKVLSLNYGRRINRPDYNVLNPFRVQQSELSFRKGNAFLNPEIVNNIELGYTLNYKYNFKVSYSKTTDQITRLIAPDEDDPRAGFITWANLAEQTIYGFNVSAPFGVTDWWNVFANFSAGYLNNQADYGDGAIVDVQALTYTLFQQSTFTLPKGFTGEISGYYSGPGVWGGVFKYDPTWSLNLGLQKKFFNDMMNVKLSANDIFFQSGWEGVSEFNGLVGEGMGSWDSRRVSLSMSYNFGNSNVKSRKRKTGLDNESKRVGKD